MKCARCGSALHGDVFRGLCHKCVFAATLKVDVLKRAKLPDESQGLPSARIAEEDKVEEAPEFRVAPPARGATEAGIRVVRCFGDYELLEEIGRGGMGVIYRARQLRLNRIVAVKMALSRQAATEQFLQRFRTEAAAAAGLQHPHIVAIHEVGEHQGQPFFSMDYVEGRTLEQVISDPQFRAEDFTRIARWIETIAEAVHYAHQRGILHRDLKPSNILIDSNDRPRITDFGLAKQMRGDSDITLPGQVLGTPNYLPPEQASGSPWDVGVHSDVYSLGAILYHVLTGRPPFLAQSLPETLSLVLRCDPVAPRLLNPAVPIDLATLCLKCLEKEPAKRYQSAKELADELGRFLRDEPILARPISHAEKYWRWCRRNPLVASLASTSLLLLLAVAVGSPIAAFRINRERQRAEQSAGQSRQRLVRFNLAHGTRLLSEGDALRSLPWFMEALHLEKGHSDREEIHRVRLESILQQCPLLLHCWFHEGGDDSSQIRSKADAQFSPDGRRVLTVSSKPAPGGGRDGEVAIWDVAAGKAVCSPLKPKGNVFHAEFSSDGLRVVTASGVFRNDATEEGESRVWDALTGQAISPSVKYDGIAYHASFSRDGRRVVTAVRKRSALRSLDSEAFIWDATTGTPVVPPLRHAFEVHLARFAPDDSKVVTSGVKWTSAGGDEYCASLWDASTGMALAQPLRTTGQVADVRFASDRDLLLVLDPFRQYDARVIDGATGALIIPPLRHESGVLDAVFDADGASILTASSDYTARLWDAATGRPLTPPLRHGHMVSQASFSPDGKQVVTASFDGTARIWDRETGEPRSPPLRHHAPVAQASFSPDGRRVLTRTVDQVVRVWALPGTNLFSLSLQQSGPLRSAQFSPDGRHVLTASMDRTARIWDAATGQPIGAPLAHNQTVTRAVFSPDGRCIATASEDHTARVWDAKTGQPISPPLWHDASVWSVQFSPDSRRVVAASGSDFRRPRRLRPAQARAALSARNGETNPIAGEARVWDVATGKRLLKLSHGRTVTYAEFSSDGRRIVTASMDRTARIWDAATGRPVSAPLHHASGVLHAAFSPDGRRVLTARGAEGIATTAAQIWDATTGEPVLPPLHHSEGMLLAIFSPDGRRVATASGDGSARIWDAETGLAISPPLRQQREVTHVAFSPDSSRIVTSATANSVRVWDATTGEPVTPPLAHPDAVFSAAFSPDGRRVVTACRDGKARVWDLFPFSLSPEELALWVQVLSAHQIDRTGTDLEPLSLTAISNAWLTLRSIARRPMQRAD
ncbi:MAG: protein kinase [Verrucomicrobia bacterium]|nr:protein kinase [Verrucomicrobiota bacterium]